MRHVWVWVICLWIGAGSWVVCAPSEAAEQRSTWVDEAEGPGPQLGSPSAPLTLVEFSDFRCGYCRRFAEETLPKVNEQYIRPGKVRLIYRHLAILGSASNLAAQAASCAHDQSKFWEYHDRLFGRTSPVAFTAARLKVYAEELGLDVKTFGDCLDGQKHAKQVKAETLLGQQLGMTGTPSFLFNGRLLIGAYPFEMFRQALDEVLAELPASK